MSYRHTQRAPIAWILIAIGVLLHGGAWAAAGWVAWLLLSVGVLFFVLGASFAQLQVEDRGDHLRVAFGPLPIFRRKVPYEAIRDVRRGRTDLVDGWGIHWLPGRGVVWNIWGFDCVELELEGRCRLRIGTDDPAGLYEHLVRKAA